MTARRWFALCGIASPVVLATATIAVAAGDPEYSHQRDLISELGRAGTPGAIWMNRAGIIPAGALVALSALPVRRAFGHGWRSAAGAAALAVAGTCFVVAGLFPLATAAGPFRSTSTQVHLATAAAGFCALGLAPLLLGLHARLHRRLRGFRVPSFVASAAVFLFSIGMALDDAGLFQRAALIAFYSWLIGLSIWIVSGRAGAD